MKRNRLVIFAEDIQLITGRSPSYARNLLRTIKKSLGKEKNQFVTRAEFCKFAGLSPDDLEGYI
jgi:hypothetical protein